MTTEFSHLEGCYTYLCIFGCRGTDYESEWEAQQAEHKHDCFPDVAS